MDGDSNVIVTDGFTGNVALKTAEGTAKFITNNLKKSLTSNILAKISLIFSYFSLRKFKSRLDPRKYNGAIFLGLNGPVVKSHGGTDSLGFYYSIDLCYRIIKGNLMQGNFLLYNILGANVDVIDGENLEEIPKHLDIKYNELIKEGRKPLLIYGGFGKEDTTLAGISYANAMAEIDLQMKEQNFMADHLFVTAANMTQAGCELGAKILNWPTRIQGISPVYWEMDIKKDIARICNDAVKMLDINLEFSHKMINHDNNYVGEKYGATTEDGIKATKLLANKEGIILDPVYTSKGFAALIDYVEKGIFRK